MATFLLIFVLGSAPPLDGVEISLEGLDGELETNVRASVSLFDLGEDRKPRLRLVENLAEKARQQIERALQPFGYFNPNIDIQTRSEANIAYVDIVVDPGSVTRIATIDVEFLGIDDLPATQRPQLPTFPLNEGDALNTQRWEAAKRSIGNALLDQGFFDSEILSAEIRVRRDENVADLVLRWQLGPAHFFGETEFVGSQFSQRFMQRYELAEPDTPFRQATLLEMSRYLLDSNFFDRVEVQPMTEQVENDRVPIRVQLEPNERNLYEFGLTFGTDSGLGATALYERRYLNSFGHSLRAELDYAQRRQQVGIGYEIPDPDDLDTSYLATASYLAEESDSNDRQTFSVAGSRHSLWRGFRRVDALTLLYEEFTIAGIEDQATFLLPSIDLRKARADDPVLPRRGYELRLGAKAAADVLLSDTNLLQLDVETRQIFPVFEDDRILLRARAAADIVSDFEELPASLRFFAGGDNSIRGFDFEELGPTNDDGEVIGGKYLLELSSEYEYALYEKWRLAAFVDAGNAFSSFDDGIEVGAGLGIRYVSPVGLIRVDVAVPTTDDDLTPRLHLRIGPDL